MKHKKNNQQNSPNKAKKITLRNGGENAGYNDERQEASTMDKGAERN